MTACLLWSLGIYTGISILFISLSLIMLCFVTEKTWRVNFFFWINYVKKHMLSRNRKKTMQVLHMGGDWNLSKLKPWKIGNTGAGFSALTFPLRDLLLSILTPSIKPLNICDTFACCFRRATSLNNTR